MNLHIDYVIRNPCRKLFIHSYQHANLYEYIVNFHSDCTVLSCDTYIMRSITFFQALHRVCNLNAVFPLVLHSSHFHRSFDSFDIFFCNEQIKFAALRLDFARDLRIIYNSCARCNVAEHTHIQETLNKSWRVRRKQKVCVTLCGSQRLCSKCFENLALT